MLNFLIVTAKADSVVKTCKDEPVDLYISNDSANTSYYAGTKAKDRTYDKTKTTLDYIKACPKVSVTQNTDPGKTCTMPDGMDNGGTYCMDGEYCASGTCKDLISDDTAKCGSDGSGAMCQSDHYCDGTCKPLFPACGSGMTADAKVYYSADLMLWNVTKKKGSPIEITDEIASVDTCLTNVDGGTTCKKVQAGLDPWANDKFCTADMFCDSTDPDSTTCTTLLSENDNCDDTDGNLVGLCAPGTKCTGTPKTRTCITTSTTTKAPTQPASTTTTTTSTEATSTNTKKASTEPAPTTTPMASSGSSYFSLMSIVLPFALALTM